MSQARLGPIMQSGYVVADWRVAAEHWATRLGVGPFFAMEHVEFDECFYRGEPVNIDMTVAIAYTGDYQIELVQQHNDAPSIYADFLQHAPEGLQHVGMLTDDLDKTLRQNGLENKKIQWGTTAAGQRFAYVDTCLHEGTMLEVIETNQAMLEAFEHMRKTAANWDGTRPIRA